MTGMSEEPTNEELCDVAAHLGYAPFAPETWDRQLVDMLARLRKRISGEAFAAVIHDLLKRPRD